MLRENKMANQENLLAIYKILFSEYGNRNWWPADTPFEVIIGAILTQNVSWNNVEKAINNLKNEEILTPEKLKISCLFFSIIMKGMYQKCRRMTQSYFEKIYYKSRV